MLLVQKYFREGGSPESLKESHGIDYRRHDSLPLVILDYNQINSVKTDPIVAECRGLVLEEDSWDIIACGFRRFFNLGEDLAHQENFDWNSFRVVEKIDGSIIFLFWYKDRWIVKTRGTFADGICGESGKTWASLIFSCLNQDYFPLLDKSKTYVLEYVGPYNKIVTSYPISACYFLAMFDNDTGDEVLVGQTDPIARLLGCKIPQVYILTSREEVVDYVNNHPEATYEGVVLRDKNGFRIKVKNPRYLSLSHLRGNGNGFANKHLLPFLLDSESPDELLTYFPEVKEKYEKLKLQVEIFRSQMMDTWNGANHSGTQKEFALSILGKTPFVGILFLARQKKVCPSVVWKVSDDLILKVLENGD